MARTWDAVGTLRTNRKPGEINVNLPKFWIEAASKQTANFVTGDSRTLSKWVNKYVYFRGCVESQQEGRPPVVRTTYLGDDPVTRDATPPCR